MMSIEEVDMFFHGTWNNDSLLPGSDGAEKGLARPIEIEAAGAEEGILGEGSGEDGNVGDATEGQEDVVVEEEGG